MTEKVTTYVLLRWTGMWTEEGLEWEDYSTALEELKFHRETFPEEKFALVKRQGTVIYRREEA